MADSPTEHICSEQDLIERNEDHSDLSKLDERFQITSSAEWIQSLTPLILVCGCVHYVQRGDVVWYAYDTEMDETVPVGVDVRTIH